MYTEEEEKRRFFIYKKFIEAMRVSIVIIIMSKVPQGMCLPLMEGRILH